uniref:manganese transport system membrane protein n=1 Tax=Tsunamia transpacifica TaxID=1935457 RepID=UPI001BEFB77F|nr:manganese transport system membrane protein [Tsunamia transpacifica]QUE27808.1 MntB [Tsunamia transpacifica]UNJ14323.1 manganese transport system membrane protein [Tsunamia transpacifica]
MQRSLIVAIAVGLLCAIVGSYLMVQRLALLGDAISHSVMPGLALAFLYKIPILVGALLAAVLSTLIIAWLNKEFPLKEDTVIGIVFASFFALGIVLITLIQKDNKIDLNHFLFGNILGVTIEDVIATSIICGNVLFIVTYLYKELLFFTFDPLGAEALGLPVKQLNFCLMVLVALTTVASMKAVGVVLVLALLIIPSASAYLLVSRLDQVMTVAASFGIISSIIGMYSSYFFNIPSGPAIVLIACICFCFTLIIYKVSRLVSEKL